MLQSPKNDPQPYDLVPLDTIQAASELTDDIKFSVQTILTENCKSDEGGLNYITFVNNMSRLTYNISSPEILTFIWVTASDFLYKESGIAFSKQIRNSSLFQELWDQQKNNIKDFISMAPLKFLSAYTESLSYLTFNRQEIIRIIERRLRDIEKESELNLKNLSMILNVYKGLHLNPPLELIDPVKIKEQIQHDNAPDLVHYIYHASRLGINVLDLELLNTFQAIAMPSVATMDAYDISRLLWSLTSQFSLAQNTGIKELDSDLKSAILQLHETALPHIEDHIGLRDVFNASCILLDKPTIQINGGMSRSSHSEKEFMRAFREYALTEAERENLKNSMIDRHIVQLGRDVDGHYMLDNQPVIIEFDGGKHFIRNLKNHRDEPNGSTKFQTHILQKLFPNHVIIRLHHTLGNQFTKLPDNEKSTAFQQLRELIHQLQPDAYYISRYQGKLCIETAYELQLRHNKEYGIMHQPTQT